MPKQTHYVNTHRNSAARLGFSVVLWIAGPLYAEDPVADEAPKSAYGHEALGQRHNQADDQRPDDNSEAAPAHAAGQHQEDSQWHRFQHWLISALGGEHPHEAAEHRDEDAKEILTATRWTQDFELFLERPPLVAGEPAELLVFLTRLTDFSPVRGGEIAVSLSPKDRDQTTNGQQAPITAKATSPSRPGIYRLRLTPARAGRHRLALAWADGGDEASFSVEVMVAARGAQAQHGVVHVEPYDHGANHDDPAGRKNAVDDDHADHGGEVSQGDSVELTKEQQWLSEFATAVVERRVLRGSVAATGVLRASADGDAHVTTPIDAHLRSAGGGFPYTGMRVEPGQILAYLVPRLGGEADVVGLELAVTRAATTQNPARQERERLDALWEDRSIPFREVLQARGDEDLAAAELNAARRRLAQVQRTDEGEAAGVPVRAPIGGVVARVEVAPGAFVEEGVRLFHLVSPERLWLDARVAEVDLGRIQRPTGAWFSARGLGDSERDGNGQVFALTPETGARLVAHGALVDSDSRTVPMIFEFSPARYPNGERLRVGQSVSARVYTGEQSETLVVPAGALVNDAGADVVYIQVAGDRFERRLVHRGRRDGDLVGVHDGVRAGERIVSRGAYLVHLAAGAAGDAGHHHGHDH